jgi:hypothetical protein
VLADVVRVVRTFRPDVIVTRFATDGSGGHGHHTASAILAGEAFDLAADPRAFPEQIAEGLEPWQAKHLFFNAASWWNPNVAEVAGKDPARWVAVDVGGFDPLLGASYTEIAGRSRSQHKSQGFGAAETRGEQIEYLRLEKGAPLARPDLFDGVELGWSRVTGAERVPPLVREIVTSFDAQAPERSVAKLEELARVLDNLGARLQGAAARELILQAMGVVVEVGANAPCVAAGDSLKATVSVLQRRSTPELTVARRASRLRRGRTRREARAEPAVDEGSRLRGPRLAADRPAVLARGPARGALPPDGRSRGSSPSPRDPRSSAVSCAFRTDWRSPSTGL